MTRSRLRNKYMKEKSADSQIAYDNQRYYVNVLYILLILTSVL